MMKKLKTKLYPFLLCLYPILALWNHNISFVRFSSVIRSLLVSVIATALVWSLFRLLLKDWQKVGLMTTLGVLLFFSYGHVYLFLGEQWAGLAHHRYLFGIYLGFFLLGGWLIVQKLNKMDNIERFLMITGAVMIGSVILQLGYQEYSVYRASNVSTSGDEIGIDKSGLEDGDVYTDVLPDVYWIILDAYGRSDVLMDYYDYDNSEFIQALTDMGFYVATCSQTNYPDTVLSLVSTMNMDYLQNVISDTGLLPQLSRSEVKRNFDSLGYQTISFENYFGDHYDLFEDVRLTRHHSLTTSNFFKRANEFENLLMNTSMLKLFVDMPQLVPDFLTGEGEGSWHYEIYYQTQYSLDTLENMPELERPIFVFAHLVVPHTPYIFNPDGSFELTDNDDESAEKIGYRNNVAFIDNRLPIILESIIENSEVPPIIIIQGDHGPTSRDVRSEKRMPILNAYFLSDEAEADMYSYITPVNTFRVVFNYYFGGEYELLDDLSYFAWGKGGFLDEKIISNPCISE